MTDRSCKNVNLHPSFSLLGHNLETQDPVYNTPSYHHPSHVKGRGGACLRRGTCYECSSWHHEHLHRALFRPVRHRSGMKLLEERLIPNLEVARQRTTPIRQILESLVPVSTESTREHANVSEDTLMREGRWSESERILHGTYIVLQEVYPYAPQNQSQSRVKYSQEV